MSEETEAAPLSWTTADFTFKAGELPTETLNVISFNGIEGISELARLVGRLQRHAIAVCGNTTVSCAW